MTHAGMILGTAAYIAPEQARGKPVDRRADIWAFGVVLYEVLAGRQLFGGGETLTDTLAAVVTREPDWNTLPAGTPRHIRRLLERCLCKDPKRRLRDIGEVRIILDECEDAVAVPTAASSAKPQRAWLAWTVAGVLAVAFAVTGVFLYRATRPHPLLRFNADLGADVTLQTGFGSSVILSPDGSRLVFAGVASDSKTHLCTRLLDQPRAVELTGTDGARDPFFSPDGQWIGFFAESKLKKISVQGGAAITLCDAPDARGGSWREDRISVTVTTIPQS